MILGVEALVFERVVVSETAKLPKFFNGLFEESPAETFAVPHYLPGQADRGQQPPLLQASNAPQFQRVPYSSESRFGPSRFSGPRSGNYGGPRVDLSRSGINANSNQTPNAFPVSLPNGANAAGVTGDFRPPGPTAGPKTILTKDWMPWSLLAAGAIIFLYTSSHGRSGSV